MEGNRTDLEEQAHHQHGQTDDDEGCLAGLGCERVGDFAEVHTSGEAVDQGGTEEEERRGEGSEDEVLERGLLREQAPTARHARQEVERKGHDLQGHEHHEEVGRGDEEEHAEYGEEEERPHLGLEVTTAGEFTLFK